MEDKRTALAILLCLVVVMVYSEVILTPMMRPNTVATAPQTSANSNESGTTLSNRTASDNGTPTLNQTGGSPTQLVGSPSTHPSFEEISQSGGTVIESTNTQITISHLGARVQSYKLLGYKAHLGSEEPLDMVSHVDGTRLPGGVQVGNLSDERVSYSLVEASDESKRNGNSFILPQSSELALKYSGKLSNGSVITKTFKFGPTPYLTTITVALDNPVSESAKIWLDWSHFFSPADTKSKLDPHGFVLLNEASKITRLPIAEVLQSLTAHGENRWVSLADKYFIASLIPTSTGPNTQIGREGDTYYAQVRGESTTGEFKLYGGPKETAILQATGHQLERSIDLGTFAAIAYPLLSGIRFFHSVFGNYGLAIIALTLLIKTLFLPLTKASFISMRKMQDLQPEMKALRERIKDATELNKAVLDLYKKRGVNPMGGCLPMLIQLPVFLGLYNALLNSIELRHAPYALWINDLSAPEGLTIFGISIPVMVLIMGASMYFQMLTTPQTGDPQQQKIMKMMPIVFTAMFIIFPMPAGLVLYWLVNNTISIIQQVVLRSERKANAYAVTALASLGIFSLGYVITLL